MVHGSDVDEVVSLKVFAVCVIKTVVAIQTLASPHGNRIPLEAVKLVVLPHDQGLFDDSTGRQTLSLEVTRQVGHCSTELG